MPGPANLVGLGYHHTTMKFTTRLFVLCVAAGALPLAGCSSGLSEAKVQAMIDKSIAKQLASQAAEESAPAQQPDPSFSPPPRPSNNEPSAELNTDLNSADMAFKAGVEDAGCQWVANAISTAARSTISDDQSRQLSSYAARCKLRY